MKMEIDDLKHIMHFKQEHMADDAPTNLTQFL